MKEKYTYPSDILYVILIPTFLLIFILSISLEATSVVVSAVSGTLLLFCLLLLLVSSYVPCSFEAQEKEVRFIKAFIKTDVIKYSDIRSMEISREHYDTRYGTRWLETICFKLDDRELTFSASMDIDYYKLDNDPTQLGKQFENSKFANLKRFIETKMNTKEEN